MGYLCMSTTNVLQPSHFIVLVVLLSLLSVIVEFNKRQCGTNDFTQGNKKPFHCGSPYWSNSCTVIEQKPLITKILAQKEIIKFKDSLTKWIFYINIMSKTNNWYCMTDKSFQCNEFIYDFDNIKCSFRFWVK